MTAPTPEAVQELERRLGELLPYGDREVYVIDGIIAVARDAIALCRRLRAELERQSRVSGEQPVAWMLKWPSGNAELHFIGAGREWVEQRASITIAEDGPATITPLYAVAPDRAPPADERATRESFEGWADSNGWSIRRMNNIGYTDPRTAGAWALAEWLNDAERVDARAEQPPDQEAPP